uniref:PTB domain-containing protein n=1 Tax=Amphiprion percula TaxID=161767 RepID=A0A3P8TEH9_AMPPE
STSSMTSSHSKAEHLSAELLKVDYKCKECEQQQTVSSGTDHLFTCELDGREMRNIRDCVERLKLLEEMGRVWGQNMLLEVRDANLLLTDIESKEELDSLALSDIQDLQAVLDAGVFNSLLTVSVQQRRKHTTTDILNHIFNDIEIFMGQVAAAEAKNTKKKKKKKKEKVI